VIPARSSCHGLLLARSIMPLLRGKSTHPGCSDFRNHLLPGIGPITALAFAAAIDDPHRFKKSRNVGAYLGLAPQRHQSGEIDYTGSISKRCDVKVRTLLYEAANVMLTRYAAPLKLKSWAVAIAARSTMRKGRVALARRPAIILHAIMRDQTNFKAA